MNTSWNTCQRNGYTTEGTNGVKLADDCIKIEECRKLFGRSDRWSSSDFTKIIPHHRKVVFHTISREKLQEKNDGCQLIDLLMFLKNSPPPKIWFGLKVLCPNWITVAQLSQFVLSALKTPYWQPWKELEMTGKCATFNYTDNHWKIVVPTKILPVSQRDFLLRSNFEEVVSKRPQNDTKLVAARINGLLLRKLVPGVHT